MLTESTQTLFAAYQRRCLDNLAQHGLGTGGLCRCGTSRPCPAEIRWVHMLETVVAGVG